MADEGSRRVLVIHSDRELGSAIGTLLARSSFPVDVVTDGIEGLLSARRLAPQVVLCEVNAPRLGAIDLCRTIRHEPGVASAFVLVLAADPSGVDRAATLDAGADEVLAGPFDAAALVAAVRAGLRGRDAARLETSARQSEVARERAAHLVADVNNALMALVGHLALVRQYLERSEAPRASCHVEDAQRAADRIADAARGFLVECERACAGAAGTAAADPRSARATADRA